MKYPFNAGIFRSKIQLFDDRCAVVHRSSFYNIQH
nr:MAG TPA: hypothetical protein [Bacteriophage sp.]